MERFIPLFCQLTDSARYENCNFREFLHIPDSIVLSCIDFYSIDLRKSLAILCKFCKIIVYDPLFFLYHDIHTFLSPRLSKNNYRVACLTESCCLFSLKRKTSISCPKIIYWFTSLQEMLRT